MAGLPPFTGTIIIDSREQKPFDFSDIIAGVDRKGKSITVKYRRGTLPTGDYSIDGWTCRIAVERKSLSDLYSSLGKHSRDRFRREIDRLNQFDVALVVVEADWATILNNPPKFTRVKPGDVYRTINAWKQVFPRVHWDLMPDREMAELNTFRTLEYFWRQQQP
jgi:ERCC4-type nuclease